MLGLPTPAPGELRNWDSDGLSLRILHPIIGHLWVWALVIVGQVLGKYMMVLRNLGLQFHRGSASRRGLRGFDTGR